MDIDVIEAEALSETHRYFRDLENKLENIHPSLA